MSELSLTIIKLGFLAVLWLFVLSAVSVIRTDIFGTRVSRRSGASAAKAPSRSKPAKQPKKRRPKKGAPTAAVVTDGASAGSRVDLDRAPITIGRGNDCELRVDDEYVSTRHAILRRENGNWYVEDLGSTNGTFVDGSRVHGVAAVRAGAPVRVGKTVIELTP